MIANEHAPAPNRNILFARNPRLSASAQKNGLVCRNVGVMNDPPARAASWGILRPGVSLAFPSWCPLDRRFRAVSGFWNRSYLRYSSNPLRIICTTPHRGSENRPNGMPSRQRAPRNRKLRDRLLQQPPSACYSRYVSCEPALPPHAGAPRFRQKSPHLWSGGERIDDARNRPP